MVSCFHSNGVRKVHCRNYLCWRSSWKYSGYPIDSIWSTHPVRAEISNAAQLLQFFDDRVSASRQSRHDGAVWVGACTWTERFPSGAASFDFWVAGGIGLALRSKRKNILSSPSGKIVSYISFLMRLTVAPIVPLRTWKVIVWSKSSGGWRREAEILATALSIRSKRTVRGQQEVKPIDINVRYQCRSRK